MNDIIHVNFVSYKMTTDKLIKDQAIRITLLYISYRFKKYDIIFLTKSMI